MLGRKSGLLGLHVTILLQKPRDTQPLSPTIHYRVLSEERACFLYLQDRIPGILVALPDAWISASCYRVTMVSWRKERAGSCIVIVRVSLFCVLTNYLQIATRCLMVIWVCCQSHCAAASSMFSPREVYPSTQSVHSERAAGRWPVRPFCQSD